jgi:hypothetical protein
VSWAPLRSQRMQTALYYARKKRRKRIADATASPPGETFDILNEEGGRLLNEEGGKVLQEESP